MDGGQGGSRGPGEAGSTTSSRSPGWRRCSPGRDEVHPAETLLLRARLDAQQGRTAEARYGLRAATAALEERPSERSKQIRQQLEALRERLES